MTNPANIGDHVKGVFELGINAQDDIGVTAVLVAITKDGAGNLLPEGAWDWQPAILDPVSGQWIYPVDTTLYPDGDLPLLVKAQDGSGKEVIFEGMYSAKNGPVEVEVEVPAQYEEEGAHKFKDLITGGDLYGVAKDLWGVAPGYPKIQFWHASQGDNLDNPRWDDLDSYAAMSAEAWAAFPGGKTALQFQYKAVDRTGAGNQLLDEMPSLQPGPYRFRFLARDVDGMEALYPPAGSEKSYYEVNVVAAHELPAIAIHPLAGDHATPLSAQFLREPFYLAAEASHTTGIYRATIEVQKEGEAEPVVLARGEYSVNTPVGEGANATLMRRLETYMVTPGQAYVHTDVDAGNNDIGAVASYHFGDGIYNFIVSATSMQSSFSRQVFTVYIDTTPPEISVTRVQPAVETRNPGASGLDEFTVNGFVAADMSYYDANNIGTEPGTGFREIRYVIKDGYDPGANAQALYNEGRYFDDPAEPVHKRAGSTSSVIIDTTHPSIVPSGDGYYNEKAKYLHLMARDRAGNHSFTAVLLKVNQRTDIPTITITGFDLSQRSQGDLAAAPIPNRLDTNRLLSGTLTDDDGIFIGATPGDTIKLKIYQDYQNVDSLPRWEAPIAAENLDVLNGGRTVNFRVTLPPAPEPGGGGGGIIPTALTTGPNR
jgi:hypothetical protein